MARTRNIKPGFFKNETLSELSFETRLLFIGLWTIADRSGRLEDRPKRIHAELFPYDRRLDLDKMLDQLDSGGFILRYILNGSSYIQIPKWFAHQTPHPRENDSTIPPIPLDLSDFEGCRAFSRQSRALDMPSREKDMPSPSFNPSPNTPSPNTPSIGAPIGATAPREAWFEEFWSLYPRKTGKQAARAKFFAKVKTPEVWEKAKTAITIQSPVLLESEPKFRPHAATWLNQERWNDEPDPESKAVVPISTPQPIDRDALKAQRTSALFDALMTEQMQ